MFICTILEHKDNKLRKIMKNALNDVCIPLDGPFFLFHIIVSSI